MLVYPTVLTLHTYDSHVSFQHDLFIEIKNYGIASYDTARSLE